MAEHAGDMVVAAAARRCHTALVGVLVMVGVGVRVGMGVVAGRTTPWPVLAAAGQR